jgi:hypothetical protein
MRTQISPKFSAVIGGVIGLLFFGSLYPSFAAKPVCPGPHPSCGDDNGSGDEATYSAEFGGEIVGQSGVDNWVLGFLGKNSIGLNDAQPAGLDVGTVTSLNLLPGIENGDICFQSNSFPNLTPTNDPPSLHNDSSLLHQAYIKEGKGGRAESRIWLHGVTILGQEEVLYVLKLFGQFDPETAWPPTEGSHLVMFYDWELAVEGGKKATKDDSCAGEGTTTVAITVTAEL